MGVPNWGTSPSGWYPRTVWAQQDLSEEWIVNIEANLQIYFTTYSLLEISGLGSFKAQVFYLCVQK